MLRTVTSSYRRGLAGSDQKISLESVLLSAFLKHLIEGMQTKVTSCTTHRKQWLVYSMEAFVLSTTQATEQIPEKEKKKITMGIKTK